MWSGTIQPPNPFNPPASGVPEDVPLTQAAVEKTPINQIRSCLACGQPNSRYLGDGSSVHFLYQVGDVKYFYCSRKVFEAYSAEGLLVVCAVCRSRQKDC
ncbi:hypothetical protein AMELA_G00261100 [Ameiurus melas]|uniref:Uncharacterized protein n=1 Tax=Ameiurus melas TaxID=219545 RepID=A0A7J5ZNN4_AMEME|nr:hypothetical protein AMELA_G00261100 [Ameiurus melas]